MMSDKSLLRSDLRARRTAAGPATIAAPAVFRTRLSPGLTVASYVPIGSEADPSPLARAAVEAGCTIVLPHVVDRASPLRFLAWDTEAALSSGPFGLHQPADDAADHVPDIVLTPLLGFDRRGNRLGQGAGHYDRAFLVYPDAWRVGIALSVQEVDTMAADPWDVPLHAIATELEWIMPEGTTS